MVRGFGAGLDAVFGALALMGQPSRGFTIEVSLGSGQ